MSVDTAELIYCFLNNRKYITLARRQNNAN